MKVELNKRDLITLLFGVRYPDYDAIPLIPKKLGHYESGIAEDWVWNTTLIHDKEDFAEFTEEYLWDLYQKCKHNFVDY